MASEIDTKEEERVEEEEDEPTDDGAIISPDALIKHPLQNKWALWFFKNDRTKEWTANLKLITAFDTVEDFWGLYNHVQKASKLPSGCDYSLFKDGVQPMWEDERNKDGGRWLINLNKNQRQTDLDNFWLETLLCLIGESFEEYSEDICGAVVNIRNKGDKLSLWTKEASRPDAILKIGKKLKERLSIPPKIQIGFQAHTDTMTKTGSTAKDRFRV
ncbi:eukaryotic translation initiation factor 4E-like isoform X2 [Ostrea edulis]|uniref:eukaryotic translation initiation factor 4E-like isoform X2 n=1 Tax=Ostrea edulis TaxID=37623 RepID=UPI002095C2A9|nr:eukaryotic translation initiation factor 4E-like isoform X2 [Ostrea edulis]